MSATIIENASKPTNPYAERFAKIMSIDIAALPQFPFTRHEHTRKERAAKIRQLFTRLGIGKFYSVTAPSYSMASSVHISLKEGDPVEFGEEWSDYAFSTYSAMPEECPAKQLMRAASDAKRKTEQILDHVFPTWGDRSDLMTDWHDFLWCIQ